MGERRVKSNRGEKGDEARQIEAAGGMWRDVEKLNLRDWEWFTFDRNVPVTGGLCTSNSTGGQELDQTRIPVRTASVKSLRGVLLAFFPLELCGFGNLDPQSFSAACTPPHSSRCRHSLPSGPVVRPDSRGIYLPTWRQCQTSPIVFYFFNSLPN